MIGIEEAVCRDEDPWPGWLSINKTYWRRGGFSFLDTTFIFRVSSTSGDINLIKHLILLG